MSTWTIWRWKDVEFWNVPPLCHSPFNNLGWLSPKCSSTGSGSTHAISEIFPWQIEPPHWKMAKTSRCKDAKGRQTSPTFFFFRMKATASQSQTGHRYALLKLDFVKYYHLLVRLLRQRRSRPFQLESEAGSGPVGSVPMLIRAGWNSSRGRVELQPPSHAWLDPQRFAARNSRIELQNIQLEWKNLEIPLQDVHEVHLYTDLHLHFLCPNRCILMHPSSEFSNLGSPGASSSLTSQFLLKESDAKDTVTGDADGDVQGWD